MNWQYTLSTWEYICIGLFIGLYLAYGIRVLLIARKLRSSLQPILGKAMLRTFYFALFIIALMGPSLGTTQKEVKAMGKDIYLLVDLSQSMNANDIAPSRLERVKFELRKLVKTLESNRIGLIIFSSEAFIQCPLTYDQSTILLFIETLKTSLVPTGGTNFEPALQLALNKHTDSDNSTLENQAKVMVMFTDGENFGDNIYNLARDIENRGIRLLTVGVGSLAGGKIPNGRNFKKNKQGEEIITVLQQEELQRLSGQNGDAYFEISETKDDMPKLLHTILTMEGQILDKKKVDIVANKYYYFLLAGLFLLMIDVLITTKTIQL
jgi:Ca-activated chloride channel family protein